MRNEFRGVLLVVGLVVVDGATGEEEEGVGFVGPLLTRGVRDVGARCFARAFGSPFAPEVFPGRPGRAWCFPRWGACGATGTRVDIAGGVMNCLRDRTSVSIRLWDQPGVVLVVVFDLLSI